MLERVNKNKENKSDFLKDTLRQKEKELENLEKELHELCQKFYAFNNPSQRKKFLSMKIVVPPVVNPVQSTSTTSPSSPLSSGRSGGKRFSSFRRKLSDTSRKDIEYLNILTCYRNGNCWEDIMELCRNKVNTGQQLGVIEKAYLAECYEKLKQPSKSLCFINEVLQAKDVPHEHAAKGKVYLQIGDFSKGFECNKLGCDLHDDVLSFFNLVSAIRLDLVVLYMTGLLISISLEPPMLDFLWANSIVDIAV